MPINLSVLNRYSRLGASSRLRTMQYSDYLLAEGICTTHNPLFSEQYLRQLYSGISTVGSALSAYVRRVRVLRRASRADVLWLEKEALPWLPFIIERTLLPRRVPVVVDYDDAVFHRYDRHRSPFVRHILGRKLDRLMASAALVTAGNQYLAERARQAGAARVEIVPTVVDLAAYQARCSAVSGGTPTIGWIGTPSTWSEYMAPMMPLLISIAADAGARILSVGAGRAASPHLLLDSMPWTEASEVARIQAMDIGVMPLTDTPWARGKCGYKLIQYMACGVPVIASPVGVNSQIVEHGVNGFLASTEREWAEALRRLLRDPALRVAMGREGRRKVENDYSLQVWGPRVAGLIAEVARGATRL